MAFIASLHKKKIKHYSSSPIFLVSKSFVCEINMLLVSSKVY